MPLPMETKALAFATLEGLVEGRRLPGAVGRDRERDDGEYVGEHHRHARRDLDAQHLHPELETVGDAEEEGAGEDADVSSSDT